MEPQHRTRAILRSQLEPTMRLLLVAIADHMNPQDVCWIKPETMAEETGLAESTVHEWLAKAEAAGVLVRVSGEHKAKDCTIRWDVLATYKPVATKRGGARGPKTGGETPNTGADQGSDVRYAGVRSSVSRGPNIGPEGSEHRTRSAHEAPNEATREAPTRAREARLGDGLRDLGIPDELVDRLVTGSGIETPEELLPLTEDEVRRLPRMGEGRAKLVAKACARAGKPLATVPRAAREAPPGRGPPTPAGPFDWDDPMTWPDTFDGRDHRTWPPEALHRIPARFQPFAPANA